MDILFMIRWTITALMFYSFSLVCVSAYAVDQVTETFKLISKKDWQAAINTATPSNNEDLLKIIKTQRYLDYGYSANDFHEIKNFIHHNPHWAQIDDLKLALEKTINDSTDLHEVYTWFQSHLPRSSNGYWYYAMSASKHEHDKQKLSSIVKTSWVKSNWSKEDNANFLKQYSNYLTYNDHVAKIECLISKGNFEAAESLFSLIKPESIKLLKIQIDLASGKNNAGHMFEKLHKADKHDAATAVSYLSYFRTQKADYHEKFYNLLTTIKDNGTDARWTDMRLYFARDLMGNGHLHKAYKVISVNYPQDQTNILDTNHLAGLLAYKMKKYDDAITHFSKCLEVAQRPTTIARSNYWLGQSYTHKDKKLAQQHFKQAAKYNFVFYGQISLLELGIHELNFDEAQVTNHDLDQVRNGSLGHATRLVIKHGGLGLAEKYAQALVNSGQNSTEISAAVKYISQLGGSPYVVGVAGRSAVDKGVFVRESFPIPFKAPNSLVELPMIYAVIRQESTYDQYVVDSMDGRGLMQIMPNTCKSLCKSLNIACDKNRLLSDASYNILLGSKHLADHLKTFGGYYVPSIPSYNAGDNRLKQWIAKFGDPRHFHSVSKVAEWIEMIPFQITRAYVQKILEVMQIYRVLFTNDHRLHIKKDLLEKRV